VRRVPQGARRFLKIAKLNEIRHRGNVGIAVARNALAAQNATASEGFCLSLFKNVPLRIKVLHELREEVDALALPLLNAVRPDPVCPAPLTSSAGGPGRTQQLNPA